MKIFKLVTGYLVLLSILACNPASSAEERDGQECVMENILARKSVRSYSDREVEKDKIDLLLRAAMAAPSGKDTRPWEFIVIDDREILEQLAGGLPYAKMLSQAPCAIVVCGDSVKSSYWYLDCSAATQNLLLAAEAQGLGAVWTAAYPYEDRMEVVKRYTRLPDHILPLCVIPVGYPAGNEKAKDKYNNARIHLNVYR